MLSALLGVNPAWVTFPLAFVSTEKLVTGSPEREPSQHFRTPEDDPTHPATVTVLPAVVAVAFLRNRSALRSVLFPLSVQALPPVSLSVTVGRAVPARWSRLVSAS